MFSLKMHGDDPKPLRIKRLALALIAVAAIVLCILLHLEWSLAVLVVLLCYIVKNIIYAIVRI